MADVIGDRVVVVEVCVLPHYAGPTGDDFLKPAQPGDAGIDLYAAQDYTILPGERAAVSTGLSFAIPDGYELQVRPKSGLALNKGLTILNTPGCVDSGYRGEVFAIVFNSNPVLPVDVARTMIRWSNPCSEPDFLKAVDKNTLRIKRGEKVAQMVYARFERPDHQIVTHLSETARGDGAFGSTGV